MTLVFLSPWLLLLCPLALLPFGKKHSATLPVSSLMPYALLQPGWRERLTRYHPLVASIGLLILIMALAEPTLQKVTRVSLRQGVNLMLVLDISASMRADDIKPSRMDVARKTAADFIHSRKNDKVGVILFSGVPFLLAPPTDDQAPVMERLMRIEPDRIGTGTAIGDALAAAAARLPQSASGHSAIVLLTDGTSNRGQLTPVRAAQAAASLGIKVYTIGFGSHEGALLPTRPGLPPQRVVLDETPLQKIAELSGGQYFRATGLTELEQVYQQIDRLEKTDLEIRNKISIKPIQPALLLLTAFLFTIELILFRMVARRIP